MVYKLSCLTQLGTQYNKHRNGLSPFYFIVEIIERINLSL